MKFQDISNFFQEPPRIQLVKEVAVCYVLAMLLEKGSLYGTALVQWLEMNYPKYRLSDTVLYTALKFLEEEQAVIEGCWQKAEGRGRPRRMYTIKAEKIELAQQFGQLWYQYLAQNGVDDSHQQSG
jgi:DNA-binding PadR family transcriptional regulator